MLVNVSGVLRGYSLKQLLVRVAEEYLWWIVKNWPGFEGVAMRHLFLKVTTKRLDGFAWIAQGCTIHNSWNLSIGKGFATSRNVYLDAIGGIEIGDDGGIGPNTVILAQDHRMVSQGGHYGPNARRYLPIRIGSRVWIGAGCYLKAGITIGDDAVIAANSNVIADVPPRTQMIGVPARPYFQVMREWAKASRPALPS